MLPFPEKHKEITQLLLNGKFILQDDELYAPIEQDKAMYIDFFRKTFDYELVTNSEYIYLRSTNQKDKSSRDFLIFLALICRELDKNGKDFKKEIETEVFLVEDIKNVLNESSKKREIIDSTSITDKKGDIDLASFLDSWQRRNLIQFIGNGRIKFRFTKAVGLFYDFAVTLANQKLNLEDQTNPISDSN